MENIPNQLIWAHILPQLDTFSYLSLFRQALSVNDHSFIINYIIQSYKFIDPSSTLNSNEDFILMEEIVLYAIKYLEENDLFNFINIIKFQNLCIWDNTYKYWKVIIERNNNNILQFFMCCNDCAWDALFYAIDNNNEIAIKNIIDNGFKDCMIFRHYLKIILECSNSLWNYLINLIVSDDIFRKCMFHEANVYSNFINNSLLDINNIAYDEIFYDVSVAIKPNKKKSKKIKKKLRRLQKAIKLPGLCNLISSYFDNLINIELRNEHLIQEDDEEYTDY